MVSAAELCEVAVTMTTNVCRLKAVVEGPHS